MMLFRIRISQMQTHHTAEHFVPVVTSGGEISRKFGLTQAYRTPTNLRQSRNPFLTEFRVLNIPSEIE